MVLHRCRKRRISSAVKGSPSSCRLILVDPKQVGDVVDSIGQARPALGAAAAGRVRGAVEAAEQGAQLCVVDPLELGWEPARHVAAQAQRLAGHRQRHQHVGDGLVRDLLGVAVELVEQRLHPRPAPGHQLAQQPERQAGVREQQAAQEAAPQLDRLLERGVERLDDLGLEPRLLVPADRQVREQNQLRLGFGVALMERCRVRRECLTQVLLTVGWVAWPQAFGERRELRRGQRQETSELTPDLLEHLAVATRDRVAGALEGRVRHKRHPHRIPDTLRTTLCAQIRNGSERPIVDALRVG